MSYIQDTIWGEFYPSAVVQLVYFTAWADYSSMGQIDLFIRSDRLQDPVLEI